MRRIAVIRPMHSSRPTGMGIAGDEVVKLLPDGVGETSLRLDRWFMQVNDARLPNAVRSLVRLGLAQLAHGFFPRNRRLVFTSHHAPLWRTGRHAVIVYDLIALRHPEQSRSQWRYYRTILPRVLLSASRIVAISEGVRAELMATFPFMSTRHIDVIPAFSPGLEKPSGQGAPFVARRREHRFLFVGARYRHKNLGMVLRAIDLMDETNGTPPRLTVVGCRREIWPELQQVKHAARIEVIPRASRDEVNWLYGCCSALIYPSLDEGQGLPPLEAFAQGCPVVVSDIPVLRETCGDGAWFIDPNNPAALARLLEQLLGGQLDADAERKQAAGRRQLQRFSSPRLRALWAEFSAGMP